MRRTRPMMMSSLTKAARVHHASWRRCPSGVPALTAAQHVAGGDLRDAELLADERSPAFPLPAPGAPNRINRMGLPRMSYGANGGRTRTRRSLREVSGGIDRRTRAEVFRRSTPGIGARHGDAVAMPQHRSCSSDSKVSTGAGASESGAGSRRVAAKAVRGQRRARAGSNPARRHAPGNGRAAGSRA